MLGVFALLLGVPSASAPQVSSGQADSEANAPDLNAIVQSLEAAEQQNPAKAQGYTMTRSYKLFHGDEIEPVSQTTAEITFVPPGTKSYVIKQSSGISRGKGLVRDILDLESVPSENSSEISRKNYEFVFLRQEELGNVPVYLLRMIPKRKEKSLLNGLVWIVKKTFRIQRIEGTPAKKPSWWLKNIEIALQYTDLEGLWLPTYLSSTATVRLVGSFLLTGETVGLQLSASEHPRPDIHNGRGFKSCGHCLDLLESGNRFPSVECSICSLVVYGCCWLGFNGPIHDFLPVLFSNLLVRC